MQALDAHQQLHRSVRRAVWAGQAFNQWKVPDLSLEDVRAAKMGGARPGSLGPARGVPILGPEENSIGAERVPIVAHTESANCDCLDPPPGVGSPCGDGTVVSAGGWEYEDGRCVARSECEGGYRCEDTENEMKAALISANMHTYCDLSGWVHDVYCSSLGTTCKCQVYFEPQGEEKRWCDAGSSETADYDSSLPSSTSITTDACPPRTRTPDGPSEGGLSPPGGGGGGGEDDDDFPEPEQPEVVEPEGGSPEDDGGSLFKNLKEAVAAGCVINNSEVLVWVCANGREFAIPPAPWGSDCVFGDIDSVLHPLTGIWWKIGPYTATVNADLTVSWSYQDLTFKTGGCPSVGPCEVCY